MKHLKYIFIFVLALLTGVAARGQSGSGFNPTSPTDPGTPTHKVFYRSTPCSGMNSSIDVKEGAAFKVTASNITNYRFDYWTVEGSADKVTTSTYNGTMGARNINLVAHYTFSPATPTDPSADTRERYTLYGLSQAAVRGTTTSYSLYLDNTNAVTDLQFDVLLPAGVSLDPAAITLAVRANGYTLTATPIAGGYTLHIAGGSTIEDNSGRLLDLPLSLSPSAADALSITLANASAHLVGGTVTALATHTGTIAVSDPAVEEEVQAQFSFDRYFNRVAFTNSSSENAETFEWNFGDGTTSTERNPFHVYTAAGTYHVTLRARNINNECIDERDIVISEPSTWTLSGDYTLDPTTEALRNFTSIDEMFSILSQGHVGSDVNVAFVSGERPTPNPSPRGRGEDTTANESNASEVEVYTPFPRREGPGMGLYTYAITDASLAGLTQLAQHFTTAGRSLTFGVPAGAAYTGNVNFTTTAPTSEVYHALADFIANMTTWRDLSPNGGTEGGGAVSLSIDGVALNFSGHPAQTEESICAGSEHTTAIDFSALGSGVRTSIQSFFATSSNHLSGYAPSSDDAKSLPAMTISHSGTDVETFRYTVRHFIHDIEFAAYDYVIRVTPPLANQSLSLHTPSEGATQRPGSQTLIWNSVKGATRYEVSVTGDALDGSAPTTNVYETTGTSKNITALAGHRYTWQVTAYGKCDELTSAERHFSVGHLANLTTTNVRVTDLEGHPLTTVGSQQEVRVVATITNTGLGTTSQSIWEDALYASANGQISVRLEQQRHQGTLSPGESYEVSFTTTTPDPEQLTVIYSVRADDKGYERESDTTDNEASSAVINISSRQIAASDYAALCAFAEAMGVSTWNTASDIVSESNYPGVSFDADGYVSSIDLHSQGLAGVLPGVVFPHLASLNLAHNQIEAPIDVFINQQASLANVDLSYNHIFSIDKALPTRLKTIKVGGQFAGLSAGELHDLAGTKGIPAVQEMAMKQYCNTFNPGTLVTYNHKAPLEPNHPTFVLLADNGKRTVGSLVYKANFGMYVLQISGDYKEASSAPLVARVQGDAASGTCLPISLTWLLGDANADNYVNVLDAQQTLNRILARQTGNFNFMAANTYGVPSLTGRAEGGAGPDDIINIQDMIATVNIFLEDAAPSAHRAPAYGEYDDNDDDALRYDDYGYDDDPVGTLRLQNGYLWLDTVNDDVAALDILIAGVQPSQISLQLPSSRYQLLTRATGEGTRLVVLSPTGDSFGTGSIRLLRVGGSRANIINATASSLDAQPLALDYYIATPTAIESVETPDASVPVYDLSGRPATKAQAKSIIITEGRKAIK